MLGKPPARMYTRIEGSFPFFLGARNTYKRECEGPNAEVTQRLAQELDVPLDVAEFVVRDVSIGRDYSFLMDGYKPRCLYWEALDMLRPLLGYPHNTSNSPNTELNTNITRV